MFLSLSPLSFSYLPAPQKDQVWVAGNKSRGKRTKIYVGGYYNAQGNSIKKEANCLSLTLSSLSVSLFLSLFFSSHTQQQKSKREVRV